MLAVTKIYTDREALEYIHIPIVDYEDYSQAVDYALFDIVDLSTNKKYTKVRAVDLYIKFCNKDFKNLLGAFNDINSRHSETMFIPLDYISYKLTEYIDEIKTYNNVINFQKLLDNEYPNFKNKGVVFINDDPRKRIYTYEWNSKIIYALKLPYIIEKLDDFGLFWRIGIRLKKTLSYLYELIYTVDTKNCIAIYCACGGNINNIVKLEVNTEIIRLMTKVKVLNGDKLCW